MASFRDNRGREWNVRITGATLEDAANAGIEVSSDFVLGLVEAVRGLSPEADKSANDAAMMALGSKVLSIKLLGSLVGLCWLGCRHHSRVVVADKVTEREFKDALVGKALVAAGLATFNAMCECFGLEIKLNAEGMTGADPTDAGGASGQSSDAPNGADSRRQPA